jgi:hypothetical protein
MRTGGRAGLAVRRDPWSARLVAIQFALSVVLLGGAGLLVSSYRVLLSIDDVIDAGRFTTIRIELPEEAYRTDDRRTAFYRRFEADVGSIPGVESVALASVAPFLGATSQQVTIRGRGTDGDVPWPLGASR